MLLDTAQRTDAHQDEQRDEHQALAAENIAEPAVDRRCDGRRHKIPRHDPRYPRGAAEIAGDRGQRRGDNRLIDNRKKHRQHD